ncbi:MAG: RNA-guided endonuclease InsQ/TnpB family protein [Microcoleus sp.]
MFGTIPVRLTESDTIRAYVAHQCKQSNSLVNACLFSVRQAHFAQCPRNEFFDSEGVYRSSFKMKAVSCSYPELCTEFKDNSHYKALGGQCAQQTIKGVVESFKSYNKLIPLWFKGELKGKPKMPDYRTKGGLAVISFPGQALQFDLETGECRIPISQENKASVQEEFGVKELRINGPVGIKPEQIVELRILPRNNEFYAEYVYVHGNAGPSCSLDLNRQSALGIDPGLSNWLTCVSTEGKSFIIDGFKIKSINQNYNRRVATIKKDKPAKYWDDELAKITEKRNRQVRDGINKASRFVINHCLANKIGHIVFGWNQGNKDEINIGTKNNQEFVQIPTARLKNRIQQLCEEVGIQFTETEESYTSKASFLDDDFLPTYGEKPDSWKPSGKRGARIKGKLLNLGRGGYQTAQGIRINSDCNGAANILRKVSTQLGLNLTKVVRAALNLPQRISLFNGLDRLYRERCEAAFKPA